MKGKQQTVGGIEDDRLPLFHWCPRMLTETPPQDATQQSIDQSQKRFRMKVLVLLIPLLFLGCAETPESEKTITILQSEG